MYYKLEQACITKLGHIYFIINQGKRCCKLEQLHHYKLGQVLLQNRAAIANWGKMYYKLGQVLQIREIITNWGITPISQRITEANPEPSQSSKMQHFPKIVNDLKPLTIFVKSSILDARMGSKYASEVHPTSNNMFKVNCTNTATNVFVIIES